ncbi:hypothetical protein B566_EDAN013673, partial [Ephemera danica]
MGTAVFLVLLLASLASPKRQSKHVCSWSIHNDLPSERQPLYFKFENNEMGDFLLPDLHGNIRLERGEEIYVACSNGNLLEQLQLSESSFRCVSELSQVIPEIPFLDVRRVLTGEHLVNYRQNAAMTTTTPPPPPTTTRKLTRDEMERYMERHVHGRYKLMLEQLSNHFISNLMGDYNIRFDSDTQMKHFNTLNIDIDIDKPKDYFFSRGHLAPNGDFLYHTHKRATYWLINVAPQWQTFNGKAWSSLEMFVRKQICYQTKNLKVFTGTQGILNLTHKVTKMDTDIYLGNKNDIKVPKLFWKIVHYEDKSVAFVGHNYPDSYRKTISEFNICTDKCKDIGFDRNLDRIILERITCCETHDLKGFKYSQTYERPNSFSGDYLPFNNRYRDQYKIVSDLLSKGDYIQENSPKILSRGHLTARSDFAYDSHQRATFWYINVAPQWQTLNGGNWERLENYVHNIPSTYPRKLEIYTGTHGQCNLPDINRNKKGVYLGENENNMIVPMMFWKVIYDPEVKLGIVFFSLNNPYEDNPGPEFYICTDVCDQIKGINWAPNDQIKGYSSCCDVREFASKVKEVPKLDINGLLIPEIPVNAEMARTAIIVLLGLLALATAQDCTWTINGDLYTIPYQPLYINPDVPDRDIRGFWLPQTADTVAVPPGGRVLFSCTNNLIVPLNVEEITLTCVGGRQWVDPNTGTTYDWGDLYCNRDCWHTAEYTGNTCATNVPGDNREVQIGFQVTSGDFYTILTTCLKYDTSDSIYSWFKQVPESLGHQSGFPRPGFVQGSGFYPSGMSVDTLYTQNSQLAAVTLSVKDPDLAASYIQAGTDFYMSRGHLAAKADFLYGSHQRASFWFMNVAPQFQTFNGGNWQTMEANMQTFAEEHTNDLIIWTGTHGLNQLLDINGVFVDISLAFIVQDDPTSGPILKSPAVFWKVIQDQTDQRSVAFLGMNNPYEDRINILTDLCPNVCDQITYLTWDPTDQVKGYAICCEVDATFLASIPEMP